MVIDNVGLVGMFCTTVYSRALSVRFIGGDGIGCYDWCRYGLGIYEAIWLAGCIALILNLLLILIRHKAHGT